MPRKYKRKLGTRAYRNYPAEHLEKILRLIENKKLSARKAQKKYGIHRNVLNKKLKQRKQLPEEAARSPVKLHGGQTILSADVENIFVSHIVATSTFGFPMTTNDLRLTVQSYLNRIGRRVEQFKNNLPGTEWARSFLERHKKDLSQRMSQNISRSRANVDKPIVESFFNHLATELENIPPCNIWNYDETNVTDDPGSKKIIVRRGCKHPNIIKNATKATISLMMCGNAGGKLAPVYVCYRAEGLYECWTEGGPTGTRYNRSKSGWFDGRVFEDWFEFLMLPILRRQIGTKILLGDNLSSHFSNRVLMLCQQNNIRFIALPPNSTHLLQPLDVAFFKPTKVAWRKVLDAWKESPEGRKEKSLPKHKFPGLLKQLLNKLDENKSANLTAGFRACGIYPFNPHQVLNRLCDEVFGSSEHVNNVSSCVVEELKSRRVELQPKQIVRRKKLTVPPGVGITPGNLLPSAQNETLATNKNAPGPRAKKRKTTGKSDSPKVQKKRALRKGRSSSIIDLSTDDESDEDDIAYADFVAVKYHGKLYPGKIITGVDETGEVCISVMNRKGKNWLWPEPSDESWFKKDQILRKIPAPTPLGDRGVFKVDLKP